MRKVILYGCVLCMSFLMFGSVFARQVHSGQYAARLEWTNAWESGMDSGLDRQDTLLPVVGGNTYTIKAWVRNGRPGEENVYKVTLADFADEEGSNHLGDDEQPWTNPKDTWDRYTYTHVTDSSANYMNVAFRMVTTSGGAIVIDDVTVYDDDAASTVTFTNPGFEDWPGLEFDPPTDWRFFEAGGAEGSITRIEAETPQTGVKETIWKKIE